MTTGSKICATPAHRVVGHRTCEPGAGARGAYWCWPDSTRRSACRRPACGAGEMRKGPALPFNRLACPRCSAGRAASRCRSAQSFLTVNVSGDRGGNPSRRPRPANRRSAASQYGRSTADQARHPARPRSDAHTVVAGPNSRLRPSLLFSHSVDDCEAVRRGRHRFHR